MQAALLDGQADNQNPDLSLVKPNSSESLSASEFKSEGGDLPLTNISPKNRSGKKKKKTARQKGLESKAASIQSEGYVALSKDPYATLDAFLSQLGMNRDNIPADSLLKLFRQEMGYFSWLKWCWIDSVVEKSFQG